MAIDLPTATSSALSRRLLMVSEERGPVNHTSRKANNLQIVLLRTSHPQAHQPLSKLWSSGHGSRKLTNL